MTNHHAQAGQIIPDVPHIPGDALFAPATATATYPWWLEITGAIANDYIAHQLGSVHHTTNRATIGPWKHRKHAERAIADVLRRSHQEHTGSIAIRNFHLDTQE